jgi:diguanylate cyclase (GGDEF)-like protein/PAS domain S-box-containing protein
MHLPGLLLIGIKEVSVTKPRRSLLPTIIFVISIITAFVAAITAGNTYRQNGQLFSGRMSDFSGGWKTADGSAVALPGSLKADDSGAFCLFNTLPPSMPEGTVLALRSSHQSLDVIIDGIGIYSWELHNKALFMSSFGLSSYFIRIPASAAGKTIELNLQSGRQGGNISVYSIMLGDGLTASVSLFTRSLDVIAMFFVLAVLFILVSISVFIFRKRIPGQYPADALYLSVFILLSAIWLMTDSSLMLLLTSNVAITLYSSLFSLMLFPIPLLLFLRRFTHRGKIVINVLVMLFLLNFFVCLALHIAGAANLLQTLFVSHLLELAACISVLTVFSVEFARYNRRDMVEVLVGLGLFCLLSISSVIVRLVSGTPENNMLVHIGLAAFIVALGIGVIRRSIHEIARSKSYEKLTLSIPCGICRIESFATGRIIFANEFYYKMFGYTEDEARRAGFHSADFSVLPEDLSAMRANNDKLAAACMTYFETEARHITKGGEIIWILARCKVDKTNSEITLVMIDITDRKRTEEMLRISEEEYRIATRHSNKLIIRLDIIKRTTYRQSDIPSIFGVPNIVENVPDSIINTGHVAPDSIEALRSFYEAIYAGNREGSAVVSLFDVAAGEFRWYHFDFTSIFDNNGKPVQAIISFYDVTLQRQKELAFQRWQQSFNAIPKSAAMYYEYNLTSDVLENEEGEMLPPIPNGIPRKLADVSACIASEHIYKEDAKSWLEFMNRDRLLERYADGLHTDKTEFRRIAGETTKWTSLGLQLIPDPFSSDVKGYFLLEDIDEQKKTEIYLQERSTLDALTGLLNRITFIEKFNEILTMSSPNTQHALIMLDIDNFKTINDTLGHTAGDALLAGVAGKLKYALRSDDLCGRLGGDEFVICLKNMNLGKSLETRVNDLCNLICDEHTWGVTVSASFGISGFPEDGFTFDELYKKADIALYKAKARGRGGYAFYDPQLSFDDLSMSVRQLQ